MPEQPGDAPPASPTSEPISEPSSGPLADRCDGVFVLHLLGVLAIFALLRKLCIAVYFQGFASTFPKLRGEPIPTEELPFFDWSIVLSALTWAPFTLAAVVNAAFVVWAARRVTWKAIDHRGLLRKLVMLLVLILAWKYSAYDYNLYYDRAHYLDRILLLVAAWGVLRNPALVGAFLPVMLVIAAQFKHPLTPYSWNHLEAVSNVLFLFAATIYWRTLVGALPSRLGAARLNRPTPMRVFLFLTLCMHGAAYLAPGLAKLDLGEGVTAWALNDELINHAACRTQRGWLAFAPDVQRVILRFMEVAQRGLVIYTLIIELAAVVIFCDRRFAQVVFVGCVGLQGGIFLTAGLLFWELLLLNVGMLLVVRRLRGPWFARPDIVLSVPLIVLFVHLFNPFDPAWVDTRLCTTFRMEVEGESGEVYEVPKVFMDPYERYFVADELAYLFEGKLINRKAQVTQSFVVERQIRQADVEEIRALTEGIGRRHADPRRRAVLVDFLRRFFGALNRRGHKRVLFSYLSTPPHNFFYARSDPYEGQEPVRVVRVYLHESYFHCCDGEVEPIREPLLLEVVLGEE